MSGHELPRRAFLSHSLAAAGAAGLVSNSTMAQADEPPGPKATAVREPERPELALPMATIGKAKISRILVGGNLISGWVHSRDLSYVRSLFHAYVDDEKVLETLALAERYGVNTVFESGGPLVDRYNRECGGHMQFIPHIEINSSQTDEQLSDHIKAQVDTGGVALYVWGVSSDTMYRDGMFAKVARGVEMAKKHGLPIGVGTHSLLVVKECEKIGVPCDFYVKTLHADDYPSATPKEKRVEFCWLDGAPGWYDNMWCLNPEETIAFMQTVEKPWLAFKILAAGAIPPQQALPWAFKNGADCVALGMFDFQVKQDCELAAKAIERAEKRARPWRA